MRFWFVHLRKFQFQVAGVGAHAADKCQEYRAEIYFECQSVTHHDGS